MVIPFPLGEERWPFSVYTILYYKDYTILVYYSLVYSSLHPIPFKEEDSWGSLSSREEKDDHPLSLGEGIGGHSPPLKKGERWASPLSL